VATKTAKVSDLTPDISNANRGTERGRYALEASLRKYGAGRSILLDKNGRIIAGNKTAETAADVGIDDVVIVQTDGKQLVAVQRTDLDLDSNEARELAYADNRVGQLDLDFDPAQILADLNAGLDLSALWHDDELDALMHAITPPPTLDELGDKYGEGGEQDFWPVIKVQVSPETKELYDSLWRDASGTTDDEKFAALLGAVDAAALGAE